MRKLERAYNEINKAKDERTKKLNEYKKQLNIAQEQQKSAQADAESSLNQGEVESYRKAKANERLAADSIEFYSIQIDKLENNPLFDDERRKQFENTIKNEISNKRVAVFNESSKEVGKVINNLQTVKTEMETAKTMLKALREGMGADEVRINELNELQIVNTIQALNRVKFVTE